MLNCVFGLMFVPLPAQQVIYDLTLIPLYAQLCLRPHVCPPACSAGDIWPYLSPPVCSTVSSTSYLSPCLLRRWCIILSYLSPPVCSTVSLDSCLSPCMLNCVFGLMFDHLPAQQVIYDLCQSLCMLEDVSGFMLSTCLLNRWCMNLCQPSACSLLYCVFSLMFVALPALQMKGRAVSFLGIHKSDIRYIVHIRLVHGFMLAPCMLFVQLSLRPHFCICYSICTLLNRYILVSL
jgi:hypothetical protein